MGETAGRFEYNRDGTVVDTEKKINSFLADINNFAKYSSIPSAIEKEIVERYNDIPQLTRDTERL